MVTISDPITFPTLSVLTNFAPTICTPVSGFPVSVTWSVKVPLALIVNAYVSVLSIISTLVGFKVETS